MAEIYPNRWYSLYQIYGDSLFELDRFWMKEDPDKRLEKGFFPRF